MCASLLDTARFQGQQQEQQEGTLCQVLPGMQFNPPCPGRAQAAGKTGSGVNAADSDRLY